MSQKATKFFKDLKSKTHNLKLKNYTYFHPKLFINTFFSCEILENLLNFQELIQANIWSFIFQYKSLKSLTLFHLDFQADCIQNLDSNLFIFLFKRLKESPESTNWNSSSKILIVIILFFRSILWVWCQSLNAWLTFFHFRYFSNTVELHDQIIYHLDR